MPITTYAELRAAAANWLVRADLTERIPEFIALAESRLNRILRTRLAEVDVALSGVIGQRWISLPAGFTDPLRVWIERPEGREELPFTEAGLMQAATRRGPPGAWAIDGPNLVFDRLLDEAYPLSLRMLRAYALSDLEPVNDLLTAAPDVYLFATLAEAGPFLRDDGLAGAYEAKLERAIEELNAQAARSRAARRLTTELPAVVGARAGL